MAREVGQAKAEAQASICDFCYQRKGRNWMIVHQLGFPTEEAFRRHLLGLYGQEGEKDGWIDSRITFYRFVHRYYGQAAHEKYFPLALVYLEAHGVRVKNRAEWIMKHRGKVGQ